MPMPGDADIEEGIKLLFQEEDCFVILEECAEAPTIREAELGEQLSNWTSTLLLALRAVNYKGSGIRAVLISENGQHYPIAAKLKFRCTNNMAEYEACILGLEMALDMYINELLVIGDSDLLIHQVQGEWATKNETILPYVNLEQRMCKKFRKIEFRHTPRAQNEFADALAIIASMIQHPESSHIDSLRISLKEEHAHCCHVEAEPDGKPRYNDIKMYSEGREYPDSITNGQKKTIRRMANDFFLNKEVMYKRMPD
ncbi:uncharacterized protein LOC132644098 [Lycium barbarum]|uniref:uncharacterized protein LOC132644098 n=1 Tax=Lycium barbarum TaxID=112863 RepID=UPI00293EF658|nr:uncharacterized protein LOC132644098 [Lycium barbarum]